VLSPAGVFRIKNVNSLDGVSIIWPASNRWKKIYVSNITPDPETGIGKWTEANFIRAMKTGLTPDGRVLDGQMPWDSFQKITDRDLKSLWAYLKTIKPIKNTPPERIPADQK
jgi:hypothetical protein